MAERRALIEGLKSPKPTVDPDVRKRFRLWRENEGMERRRSGSGYHSDRSAIAA